MIKKVYMYFDALFDHLETKFKDMIGLHKRKVNFHSGMGAEYG